MKTLTMTQENLEKTILGQKSETRRIVNLSDPRRFGASNPKVHLYDWDRAVARDSIFGFDTCPHIAVPYCHPDDGWEDKPEDDCIDRVYPRFDVGEVVGVPETLVRSGPYATYKRDGKIVNQYSPPLRAWNPLVWQWKRNTLSSRFCPHAYIRTRARITSVKFERLQSISMEGCVKEGVEVGWFAERPSEIALKKFVALWESIHGPGSWARNPWVEVIGFEVVK